MCEPRDRPVSATAGSGLGANVPDPPRFQLHAIKGYDTLVSAKETLDVCVVDSWFRRTVWHGTTSNAGRGYQGKGRSDGRVRVGSSGFTSRQREVQLVEVAQAVADQLNTEED